MKAGLAVLVWMTIFLGAAVAQVSPRAPARSAAQQTAAAGVAPRATPVDIMPGAAQGGAAQADFDTLIELITTTIAPTSWEDVGGEGAIQGFPGGVYVDASGVLKQLSGQASAEISPLWRLQANTLREHWEQPSNQELARPSEHRKVSLTRLFAVWQQRAAAGLPPTDEMQHLAGLQRVDFLWWDAELGEVILVGPASRWSPDSQGRLMGQLTQRPVLWLDDFICLLRNARTQKSQFMCAITPTTEGLRQAQQFVTAASRRPIPAGGEANYLRQLGDALGLQKIDVQGLDAGTRAARVLVEADHHMKQIGIGLEPGTDQLSSYLDRIAAEKKIPATLDVLRWWFTLDADAVTQADAGRLYQFPDQVVRVLSENELLTARGERVHTGQSDPLNAEFARDFTQVFPELCQRYPIYADLDNLFRLALVAAIIEQADIAEQTGWSLDPWLDSQQYQVPLARVPTWTPSLVNHRSVDRRRFVAAVSGGVHFPGVPKMSGEAAANVAMEVPSDAATWWWD